MSFFGSVCFCYSIC